MVMGIRDAGIRFGIAYRSMGVLTPPFGDGGGTGVFQPSQGNGLGENERLNLVSLVCGLRTKSL